MIVKEALSREFRVALPWELYSNDLVVISETENDLIKRHLPVCYLHFAPENPEDGEMYLLVPAHPGCPRQSSESPKMVMCVCVKGLMSGRITWRIEA